MIEYDRDVMKFMLAAKHTISGDNPTQADLYEKLIDEEYSEFKEAIKEKDNVEIIDSLTAANLQSSGNVVSSVDQVGTVSVTSTSTSSSGGSTY